MPLVVTPKRSSYDRDANYVAAVLADSPAGYWRMNETSGTTIIDYSGNARNGTLTLGSGALNVAGPVAGIPAIDFVTDTFIGFGDLDVWSTANETVECWARADANHYGVMVSKVAETPGHEFYIEFLDDNTVYNDLLNTVAGSYLRATVAYVIDTWYHFAFTVSGTTLTLYVNGVQVAQDTTTTGSRTGNTTTPMTAGKSMSSAGAPEPAFLNGKMCHIAYYPTALSAPRLLAHYQAMA